jgi:hypothetical protein
MYVHTYVVVYVFNAKYFFASRRQNVFIFKRKLM